LQSAVVSRVLRTVWICTGDDDVGLLRPREIRPDRQTEARRRTHIPEAPGVALAYPGHDKVRRGRRDNPGSLQRSLEPKLGACPDDKRRVSATHRAVEESG